MSTRQTRSSAKRAKQDSNTDSSAASQVEAAEQLFRRAREGDTYDRLSSLSPGASPQEAEACYMPVFKELAKIIVGRDDIVPPGESHEGHFLTLLDPNLESVRGWERKARIATMVLINYIKAENEKRPQTSHQTYTPSTEVLAAVENAWKTGYVGDNHRLLQRAINNMCSSPRFNKPYGNFLAIIQGSGTGKSRLMDQLSQSLFAIPIILRPRSDKSGYPLGDYANGKPLVGFFCGFESMPALYVQRRYLLFLLQAVAFADAWIDEEKRKGCKTEDLAAKWYEHIDNPQTVNRLEMYTKAVDMNKPAERFKDILNEDVSFEDIQRTVTTFLAKVSKKIRPEGNGSGPAFIFYFDEAHHLTKATVTPEEAPKRTAYQCLCKAFTYMKKAPVFALFLSTYSRLSEFAPSARNFWSSRPESSQSAESDDNINAPFVELPFDVWKEPILVTEGAHSSEEICSLKFMARFGRPLFWALLEKSQGEDEQFTMDYAIQKLELRLEDTTRDKLHDYPLKELIPPLAVRIDLTFESNRDEAVLLEGLLVASSMRTVYSVPQHRQYLRGGYSSEPFVAEAASRSIFKKCQVKALGTDFKEIKWSKEMIDKIIAVYKNDIPFAISAWLDKGLIEKGQRGELVARILCTLAHDISILKDPSLVGTLVKDDISFSKMIPVADFLRALIPKEDIESVLGAKVVNKRGDTTTLEEAFKNAFVHFTQFVKAGDKSTITDEAIYLLFVRGAAIQGYLNMPEADFLIPVWIHSKENPQPNRWSMTAIFIQVKNRGEAAPINIDAQERFKFFSQTQTGAHKERPYITIGMELGILKSKSPGVKVSSFELEQELRPRSSVPSIYPRYKLGITGCCKRAYNVVGEFSYSGLLAQKDMLAEHPRTEDEFLNAIRRMKPYWKAPSSYDWANMKNGSRIGAHVIEDQHAETVMDLRRR